MDIIILLLLILFGGSFALLAITISFIWLTTGFKNTGRLTGGLYTIRGKPSGGKSYFATSLAVEALKEGKRRVFSNYPIIYKDGDKTLCTLYFEAKMILEKNLNGAIVINDESHMDFWSRDFKNFTEEKKNFFSHCAQHGISFYSIVQHEDRQDTIINDCTNLFAIVDKTEIPFLEIPLFFYIEWWADEEDMKNAKYHPDTVLPYHTERVWFKKEVANAYDTRFFGHDKRPVYEGVPWTIYNQQKGIENLGSTDYSKITILRLALKKNINTICDKLVSCMPKKRSHTDIGDRLDRSLEKDAEQKDIEHTEKEGDQKNGNQ